MFRIIAIGNPEFPFKKLNRDDFEIIYIVDKEQHRKKTFVTGNPIIVVESFDDSNIRWIIESICREKSIDAIVNFDEKYQFVITKIISDLKFRHVDLNSIEIANDKFKTREIISKLKLINIPYTKNLNELKMKSFSEMYGFPIVIKNRYGTGSKDIFFINSMDEYYEISNLVNEDFIAEKYIQGKEYSVECITIDGKHYLMSVTDKITTGIPDFVEIEHIVNGIGIKYKSKIEDTIFKLFDAMELKFGISHTEFKICNDEIYIIETHVRPGGDCIMDLIENATGVNPYILFINVLLGNTDIVNSMLDKFQNIKRSSGIRYLKHDKGTIKNIDINEVNINSIDGFVRMYMPYNNGDNTHSFKNSFDRDGWIMVVAETSEKVKTIFDKVEKEIKLEIEMEK